MVRPKRPSATLWWSHRCLPMARSGDVLLVRFGNVSRHATELDQFAFEPG